MVNMEHDINLNIHYSAPRVEGINMVVKVDHEEHQKNIDAGNY